MAYIGMSCWSTLHLSLKHAPDRECYCVFAVTPWIKNPRFTYGLPEEHLRTRTKNWRYWFGVLSSAKSPCIERDSGSSVGFFHVLKAPGEPCSTVGKPHFYLLLSCSKRPTTDPPLFVFVIVNNWDKLPMINNIALTSTPLLPDWFCLHIQCNFLCLWIFWLLSSDLLVINNI